ncbi:PHD and RING finger domain-containing protein 1 [Phytophthora boehmeriae]|uniref:PHD and RING finger domain-containing protein 1 n=1 Tax=Phytophthora boehmeriae TaxID=109152 RepID=A0A8T1X0U3_9STRA|nr:PHD and RING finger domain-containing protein 1 [Phytophthora boehmeriae]
MERAQPANEQQQGQTTTAHDGAGPHKGVDSADTSDQELYQAMSRGEMERSNQLLMHACDCDDLRCRDAELGALCGHMKRFLRAACWASHDQRWRKYPIAAVMSELLTFHAMNCQLQQCNVPMCRQLRDHVLL